MFNEETNPVTDPGMTPAEPTTPETPAMPETPAAEPMPETPAEENPAA